MHIIAIANQKGGCGKTTASINLAAGLAYAGQKVLLIDLDPQGNSTIGLGIKTENRQTIAELICQEECQFNDVVQDTYIEGLHIIPSDISLAVSDVKLAHIQAKEFALRTKLDGIKYDYVIIDTSPGYINLLTNAILAAEHIILPFGLDYFNLAGVQTFMETINRTNKKAGSLIGHRAEVLGVLFTHFKMTTNHSKKVFDAIIDLFGDKMFKTRIPENVKLKECQEYGKAIYDFDPNCPAAKAYSEFTNELMEKLSYVRN
ncbi:ParA family protein [Candidatus Protochlamydia phocaeensis]|uniref:ParA family protein n=1 Tax=Candidatus Protochlamydia phocaeensis TaxID=1414722 RepID=UPI000837F8DE|nr:ParA family protein [Candidatus Protochlamydia phocaeensis]